MTKGMNYKQIGLIAVSSCFIVLIIGGVTMIIDLMFYSVIGLIVSGFTILAYYGHAELNYKEKEKIKELNSHLASLNYQLKKRTAV